MKQFSLPQNDFCRLNKSDEMNLIFSIDIELCGIFALELISRFTLIFERKLKLLGPFLELGLGIETIGPKCQKLLKTRGPKRRLRGVWGGEPV